MNRSEVDRKQVRHAIRQMGNEQIFYLLDDAISLLSQGQLRELITPYMNPEQFVARNAHQANLLAEVLEFKRASLAGQYYEEPSIKARYVAENSRGTLCWIADFRWLLDNCAAESSSMSAADACQAFEILFQLLDCLEDGAGEEILHAEEGGSWVVGVDWQRVLPAWFRVLAATTEHSEYDRYVEAIISRHCDRDQDEMQALARRIKRLI